MYTTGWYIQSCLVGRWNYSLGTRSGSLQERMGRKESASEADGTLDAGYGVTTVHERADVCLACCTFCFLTVLYVLCCAVPHPCSISSCVWPVSDALNQQQSRSIVLTEMQEARCSWPFSIAKLCMATEALSPNELAKKASSSWSDSTPIVQMCACQVCIHKHV
jgi:hypothetical protein